MIVFAVQFASNTFLVTKKLYLCPIELKIKL